MGGWGGELRAIHRWWWWGLVGKVRGGGGVVGRCVLGSGGRCEYMWQRQENVSPVPKLVHRKAYKACQGWRQKVLQYMQF